MTVFEYLLVFFVAQLEKIQKAFKAAENYCMKIILDMNTCMCSLYAFGVFGKNTKGLTTV